MPHSELAVNVTSDRKYNTGAAVCVSAGKSAIAILSSAIDLGFIVVACRYSAPLNQYELLVSLVQKI